MHLPVRRTLAAAAATASLLALAGCGGDDSGDTAADRSSASESTSAPSSDSTSTSASEDAATEDADAGTDAGGESLTGEEFKDVLQAALDKATTANIKLDLGGLGSGEGQADYTQDPPAVSVKLTMDALGGAVEVREVGGKIYLKGAQFGDKWVSVDASDPSSPLGSLAGQLDPAKQFETFAAAVTEATHVGDDEVDGETLDKYTATVDTKKLLAQMPQAGAAGAAGLPDTLEQQWWFDDEGRIRQFSQDLAGQKVTMSLSDWDADVSVEAPPASDVTPFGQSGA